jgi:hypothetical protein
MPCLQAQQREQQELLQLEEDAQRRAQARAQRQQKARGLALLRAQPSFELVPLAALEQAAVELTLRLMGSLVANELRAEAAASGSKLAAVEAAQGLGVVQAKAAAEPEQAGQGGDVALAVTASAVAAVG